jgi:hypothetical protein
VPKGGNQQQGVCRGHASKEVNGICRRRRRRQWPKPCGAFADTLETDGVSAGHTLQYQPRRAEPRRTAPTVVKVAGGDQNINGGGEPSPCHSRTILPTTGPKLSRAGANPREKLDVLAPTANTQMRPKPRPTYPDLGPPPPSHGQGRACRKAERRRGAWPPAGDEEDRPTMPTTDAQGAFCRPEARTRIKGPCP